MAPVLRLLAKEGGIRSLVCVTAQHREMLDQVLALFEIRPDHDLDLMREGQTLTEITTRALTELQPYLEREKPDLLLVQGDTTTTMAASLAAFYARVPVGHVEAGLRTWDNEYPYPEEVNRRMTSVIAAHHFAPTERARQNLLRDGVADGAITVTGNTVIDALLDVVKVEPKRAPVLPYRGKRIVLVTAHRRENFGAPLLEVIGALRDLASRFADVDIVYPVHRNPNVDRPVRQALAGMPGVHLIDPIEYKAFADLMAASYLILTDSGGILTDSGGIQEEAPSLRKPVLVLRDETERPEAVEAGVVRLVGPHRDAIVAAAAELLEDPKRYAAMTAKGNPYGDGKAAGRILTKIRKLVGT
ncbi:MAG: UDP-N-acetylglucosamine 2-epimerase (non-hydrolyzing) [Candidatus Eisenbacteria bacterium]|uniref:UDP-N-acetylglucosamine 2-epimerase (non-hydrolyzing) n=1 Tax=Eiseniibacteriota bacterium TaxID=2212470 RepID=A0A538TG61_UNCEI|nr:MAG: UDP-N-acetylglucosamine 2-epimerase (non-hydrolyzing) [Candidatus Eisenbacteria bacterium]